LAAVEHIVHREAQRTPRLTEEVLGMTAGALRLDDLTESIIGGAIAVHRAMGPGLLESVYQKCMALELAAKGLQFEQQKMLPGHYRGVEIDCVFRADLIVQKRVLLELKSVARLEPVHIAQILTYLRVTGCEVGLLINFNVDLLKNGIRRVRMFDRHPTIIR
jgi:GxxExxY protein